MKIPTPIWYIAAFLIFITLIYLMCNKGVASDLLGTGAIPYSDNNESVIQLKGQLLIDGKEGEGYFIKIMEYSDSGTKTLSEGKFEFKGIPNSEIQKVIHIQIRCPETGKYVEVERKDLTNDSKYKPVKGWIDLGIIDCPSSKCNAQSGGGGGSEPPKPPGSTTPPKERLEYFSKVSEGFEFVQVTLNGRNITINPGMTISVYVKNGDILVFTKSNGETISKVIK